MKMLACFAAGLFASTLLQTTCTVAGEGQSEPIGVTKHDESEVQEVGTRSYGFGVERPLQELKTWHVLTITAKDDNVILKKITLNRGNCPGYQIADVMRLAKILGGVEPGPEFPRALKFGEQYKINPNCDVIEATIETDKGEFAFTFD